MNGTGAFGLLGLGCFMIPLAAAGLPAASPGNAPKEAVRAAVDKAAALLASDQWEDPFGYLLSDFLYRRHAVEVLSSSGRRFHGFRAAHPEAAWVDVFRRLIDPAQVPERGWLEAAPGGVRGLDRVTVLALYCDQVPVPADYRALLEKARSEGGYSLTHAALALIWLRDNGCEVVDRSFEQRVIRETAGLVLADSAVSDLELEAAAIVTHLGHAELLPARFPAEVIAAQQAGGGWAADGGSKYPADWHPTFLALWLLLETERPGRTEPMVPRAAVPGR